MKSLGRLTQIIADRIGGAIRDVVLIVVSILIAFGLEAWWAERQERGDEVRQLESVRAEFESAVVVLTGYQERLDGVFAATEALVAVLSDESVEPDPERVGDLLLTSLNFGFQVPRASALEAALSSGNFIIEGDDVIRGIAENWDRRMEDLAVDAGHLERNREFELHQALIEAGIPGFAVIFDSALKNKEVLRKLDDSVALEAALRYRILRSSLLLESVTSARDAATRFLELTEQVASEAD